MVANATIRECASRIKKLNRAFHRNSDNIAHRSRRAAEGVVCWLLPIAFCLLAIGYWLLAIGYWLLSIGYWLLSIGYCPAMAIGYWLLAILS
jgi:hypothetical protein